MGIMIPSCAFWVNCIFGFGICVSEVCPSTCSRRLLLHITLPPETSPTWERWGPLKLRNGRYFWALCRAGTCSLVIATRSGTVHLGRSSAFLLWPLLSALPLTPRSIEHIPSRSELHQVPPPPQLQEIWGKLPTLFDLPDSQGHVPPSSHCQHNRYHFLSTSFC